jgi:hypothetical protein
VAGGTLRRRGSAFEERGQPELREELRVEEVVVAREAAAPELDHLQGGGHIDLGVLLGKNHFVADLVHGARERMAR